MKKLTFILFLFITQYAHSQSIGIGSNNPPHPSAALDVNSTTKGLLIPRMSTTERTTIPSPMKGLLVFDNTTSSFWFYNGSAWQQASLNNQWAVNGSAISYSGGRVGVGTSTPKARMAIDSSLLVDQSNSNDGTSTRGALLFGSDGLSAISRSFQTGSAARSGLSFYTKGARRMTLDSTGQLGIGTVNPLQTLHVNGNSYLAGYMGIGSSTPNYAYENLLGYNYMFYSLGIGAPPTASYLLDIGTAAPSRFQGDVRINGILNPNNTLNIGNNATVDGTLTVNNGKGVAYNANSGTNLRIYQFTTSTFVAILPGHGLSAEGAIAFNGGFTGTPRVFVGDIDVTGGTVGELYRVQLQLYGCSTTSGVTTCKARLLNTSPNPVNYTITWNCIAIGN